MKLVSLGVPYVYSINKKGVEYINKDYTGCKKNGYNKKTINNKPVMDKCIDRKNN
jgi:hypothetical protein